MLIRKIFNAKYLLISIILLLAMAACGRGGEVLATYKDEKVHRRDLRQLAQMYSPGSQQMNTSFQKKVVRDIVLVRSLSELAKAEGLDKTSSAAVFKEQVLKPKIAHDAVMKHWRDEINESEQLVYRASHILIKPDTSAGNDAMYQKLLEMREQIETKKTTFAELARKVSHDNSTRQRGGDLGYFLLDARFPVDGFPVIHKTLKSLANGQSKFLVTREDGVPVYQSTDSDAKIVSELDPFRAYPYTQESDKYITLSLDDKKGFVKKDRVTLLERKGNLSYPVQTSYGWHLFMLQDHTTGDFDKTVRLVKLADENLSDEKARHQVKLFFDRLSQQIVSQKTRIIFENSGLENTSLPELPEDYPARPSYKFGELTIKTETIKAYLEFQKESKEQAGDVSALGKDGLNAMFHSFLRGRVYLKQAQELHLTETENYERRLQWEFKAWLAESYSRKHWYNNFQITDQDIQAEYQNYKSMMNNRQGSVLSLNQVKDALVAQIRKQQLTSVKEQKQNELLEKIGFKIYDEYFSDNSL